jgi:type VI protein secretion system component VasK
MPPGMTDRFIGDSNAGYVQALGGLHDALSQALTLTGGARTMAVGQASSNVDQVQSSIRALAQGFNVDGPAREVGGNVQRLMQAPLTGLGGVIGALPAGEMNAQGTNFCTEFRPVVNKYPFTASAGTQATLDDVMGAFKPGASLLWAFYSGALSEVLEPRGRFFGQRIGADPQPSAAFLAFFNRAVTVSRGMFEENGDGPTVVFQFRPQATDEVPEITVAMDGRVVSFTRTEAASQSFTWDAATARGFRISATINGIGVPLLEGQGTWGIFRVFQQATWSGGEGGRHTVQWRLPEMQQPLVAEINFQRGIAIFNPANLNVGCIAQIAR